MSGAQVARPAVDSHEYEHVVLKRRHRVNKTTRLLIDLERAYEHVINM